MATILAAKDDPAAALTWTERGLGIETSYDLRPKHRELLTALGRHDEAIQNEWSHHTQVPTIYSYQTLMELVPETARLACVIDQCTDDHLSHAGYLTLRRRKPSMSRTRNKPPDCGARLVWTS
jgi:hypothetical protein